MAREPFFLNETLMISWFGFGYIYIYRLGIFRCLVRLKRSKAAIRVYSFNTLPEHVMGLAGWEWFLFFLGFPWRISISKPIMTLNSHTSSDILEHVGACRIASMNLLCLRWHTSDLPRCGTGLFEHRIAGWVLEVHPCWQTPCMSSWESCWCSSSIALNPTKSHSASH